MGKENHEMVEIGLISTCLKVITDGWNLVSKTLSLRPKRVAQKSTMKQVFSPL